MVSASHTVQVAIPVNVIWDVANTPEGEEDSTVVTENVVHLWPRCYSFVKSAILKYVLCKTAADLPWIGPACLASA